MGTKPLYASLVLLLMTFTASFALPKATTEKNKHFFNHNIDYQLNAHFSIGGTAPLSFPEEIREVQSFNPALQLGLGGQITKWLHDDSDWAIRLGTSIESKGMKTQAGVKNYYTEIIQGPSSISGYYTGIVQTNINNTYVTIPLSAVYSISKKVNLFGGVHTSILVDKSFGGYVSDGYLRQGTPTGTKITFDGDSKAAYDFSDAVRDIQWGMQVGADWNLTKHFNLFSKLDLDYTPVLEKDFTSISFDMHNVYVILGFGYKF